MTIGYERGMLKRPFSSLGSWIVVGTLLAWGCGDTDGGDGAQGGSAGSSTGGKGSGGGASGGRPATSGGSGGQAQAGSSPGGVGGGGAGGGGGDENGGAAGSVTAGSGGAAGSATAGNGGVAGSSEPEGGAAGSGGSGGTGALGGAGGSGGAEDPRCETIESDAVVTSHLRFTADNECEVFVNGTSVGTTANWSSHVTVDVSLFLHPGRKNVIAIIGTNTSSQGGNDRGIVGHLTVDAGAGTSSLLVTDAAWRVASAEVTGWTDLAFDDSAWIAATEIAAMGDAPWGNVMAGSGAKWIWSAAVPVDTSAKPNIESTYARREFYLSLDGLGTTSSPSCSAPE
jgi:hypothetical protein